MNWAKSPIFFSCILAIHTVAAQDSKINSKSFFSDSSMMNATLTTNMSALLNKKNKNTYDLKGDFKTTLQNGALVNEQLLIEVRGNFRLKYCYLPPVKLIFNYNKGSVFNSLKTLKLVNVCKISNNFDQYVLKEYLVYKILNILTDKSFRVRLLNLTWQDSSGRRKSFSNHAFLIENIKDLAKRNDCEVWRKQYVSQELTNRRQITLISLFQYLIGNTDWSVPAKHNVWLMSDKNGSNDGPFPVPYDFDWSGFVDANYAKPDAKLGTKYVTQRVYRGYRRNVAELNEVFEIFNQKKDLIYAAINSLNLLTPSSKKQLINYMDDFYKTINNPKLARHVFIDGARHD
jgi:hypothetical protein